MLKSIKVKIKNTYNLEKYIDGCRYESFTYECELEHILQEGEDRDKVTEDLHKFGQLLSERALAYRIGYEKKKE